MRLEALLIALLLTTPVLAGCLGGDEDVEPTGTDQSPGDDGEQPAGDEGGDGEDEGTSEGDQGAAEDASLTDPQPPQAASLTTPQVVVAHIDTGVNPYHASFRDTSALAYVHPSEYIDGYPEDVPALELTLDAPDWETAFEADQEVWDEVEEGQLYWVPGTRIVGAVSFGPGGTDCSLTDAPPGSYINDPNQDCTDHPILDDNGHGTMTGSRAMGATHSLAPDARLVTVEGTGADSVRWVADQGWIDVQTNSWLSLLPAPANRPPAGETAQAFAYAAERMFTMAASGNGAAYVLGFAPTPTHTLSTAAKGVILVGAHDNGYFTPWSGSPPHIVADGFRGWAATKDTLDVVDTHNFSCCTSSSSPYAAGGAAKIILQARALLGDSGEGIRDGIVAQGPEGIVDEGPLADGEFTMTELRDVLLKTAQARPVATDDDGEAHWLAQPADDQPEDPTNPGENAFCAGCWSTPLPWSEVPEDAPAYAYVGYGAINIFSAQHATAVLQGIQPLPERAQEDQFFAADQAARDVLYPGGGGQATASAPLP